MREKLTNPNGLFVEYLGLDPTKKPNLKLNYVIDVFMEKFPPSNVYKLNYCRNKILKHFDGDRLINTIKSKEVKSMLDLISKTNDPLSYTTAKLLKDAIGYAIAGKVPIMRHNKMKEKGGGDKLKFRQAKIEEIKALLPMSGNQGRFSAIKEEIGDLIKSLPVGAGGVIQAPQDSMDKKEAKALLASAHKMLRDSKSPWTIRYNAHKSLFIVIRTADLEKIKKSNGSNA